MNQADEYELAWWRQVFTLRFGPKPLPRIGQSLGGIHLKLQYEDYKTGEWKDWPPESKK